MCFNITNTSETYKHKIGNRIEMPKFEDLPPEIQKQEITFVSEAVSQLIEFFKQDKTRIQKATFAEIANYLALKNPTMDSFHLILLGKVLSEIQSDDDMSIFIQRKALE